MANINKSLRREVKHRKKISGMRVDGRSVFTIEEVKAKKSKRIKQRRLQKENMEN